MSNRFLIQIAFSSDQASSLKVVLKGVISCLGIIATFMGPVDRPNLDLSRDKNKNPNALLERGILHDFSAPESASFISGNFQ